MNAKLLLISFDAVGDMEFDTLLHYPNFAALAARAAAVRACDSIFLTNTYPVHASIATGQPQRVHGISSNYDPFPQEHPLWFFEEKHLRAPTIWQAAHKKGMRVASVMWPVTAKAKTIDYLIPEILARPGKSQVVANFANGSKWIQLQGFLRHRKMLDGIGQPARDNFMTACMADIIRKKKPDLMLMHLTAYDSLCHEHGRGAPELDAALESLDANLGRLLEAAGPDTHVLIFSDHAQLNIHTMICPNDELVSTGLLRREGNAYSAPDGCFFECGGGSAFFHQGSLAPKQIDGVRSAVAESTGFCRMLLDEEMAQSGHGEQAFGFCALPGYYYANGGHAEKATHGYPVDYDDYQVFYLLAEPGAEGARRLSGGSIQEITALADRILNLGMDLSPREEVLQR